MSDFKKQIPKITAILFVVIGISIMIIQNVNNKEQERYSVNYIDVFDTATAIIGFDDSQEAFQKKADILHQELKIYHDLYDIYTYADEGNNLRTINQKAGIEPVKVDQKIIDLLKYSIELYHSTNGQTNIAMGSVLSIWHNYRTDGINNPESASLPPMETLKEAAKHTDINNIIIDENASTVFLADPDMSLDVGSIGKGYAVQRVVDYAKELGYNNMIINVGGNAFAIGTQPNGNDWKCAIENPDRNAPNPALKTLTFSNRCVVTSGDYQRYYTVDGVEYCHIIDPDTLMPAEYFKLVSVRTDHSGLADALSTALFCMPLEEGLALVNSLENTEAIWVFEDGTIHYSNNFEDYIVK